MMTIFSIAFNLFILMDAIGNIPVFISLLKEITPKRQRFIIFRELLFALGMIILFNFLGDYLLKLLRVSQDSVMIAGGIILFLIALKMIFPAAKDTTTDLAKMKEPFIVPLAVPLIAGPAVLASVMLYAHHESAGTMLAAIIIAWAASTVILLCSSLLKRALGSKGIMACERLMGLLLTLIAVQMFLEGMGLFLSKMHGFTLPS